MELIFQRPKRRKKSVDKMEQQANVVSAKKQRMGWDRESRVCVGCLLRENGKKSLQGGAALFLLPLLFLSHHITGHGPWGV